MSQRSLYKGLAENDLSMQKQSPPYKKHLIFKGGMCLAQFISLGRETKDIDFLLTHRQINESKGTTF